MSGHAYTFLDKEDKLLVDALHDKFRRVYTTKYDVVHSAILNLAIKHLGSEKVQSMIMEQKYLETES